MSTTNELSGVVVRVRTVSRARLFFYLKSDCGGDDVQIMLTDEAHIEHRSSQCSEHHHPLQIDVPFSADAAEKTTDAMPARPLSHHVRLGDRVCVQAKPEDPPSTTLICVQLVNFAPAGPRPRGFESAPPPNSQNSQKRVKNKSQQPEHSDQAPVQSDSSSQSALQSHGRRATLFAQWLVETFGLESLCSGAGVLDVAGGKGLLAFALCQLGVPATVLDPRAEEDVHLGARRRRMMRQASQTDGEPRLVHKHIHAPLDSDTMQNNADVRNAIQQCSVIVGLHPDQATDAIVDAALAFQKPFAVVPCCVFPYLFTHRRLRIADEQLVPVVDRDQLCDYLMQRCPDGHAKSELLVFTGARRVVFRRSVE